MLGRATGISRRATRPEVGVRTVATALATKKANAASRLRMSSASMAAGQDSRVFRAAGGLAC